jgi:hypothetical protein
MIGISGIVHLKGKPDSPVSGATVVSEGANVSCRTDEKGWYAFSRIPTGKQNLRVLAPDRPASTVEIVVPSPNYDLEV